MRKTEVLVAHDGVGFSVKMGQRAGSHFIIMTCNPDRLLELGHLTIWEGLQIAASNSSRIDLLIQVAGDHDEGSRGLFCNSLAQAWREVLPPREV